jgi:hypothetical protein
MAYFNFISRFTSALRSLRILSIGVQSDESVLGVMKIPGSSGSHVKQKLKLLRPRRRGLEF